MSQVGRHANFPHICNLPVHAFQNACNKSRARSKIFYQSTTFNNLHKITSYKMYSCCIWYLPINKSVHSNRWASELQLTSQVAELHGSSSIMLAGTHTSQIFYIQFAIFQCDLPNLAISPGLKIESLANYCLL